MTGGHGQDATGDRKEREAWESRTHWTFLHSLEYYAQTLCFRQASNRDAVRTKTEISIELGKGRVPVSCHVEVPQKESVQQRVLRMGDSQEGNTERARKDVNRPEFQIEGEAERRGDCQFGTRGWWRREKHHKCMCNPPELKERRDPLFL